MIRSLLQPMTYVVCVEHDLSILDYLSDFICCLYGVPGAYGVVTMPSSVRQGINIFLSGFVPSENMRFRDIELTFKVAEASDASSLMSVEELYDAKASKVVFTYPDMTKTLGPFKLTV